MGLKWTDFEDGSGAFANAGGLRILVCNDGRWSVIALGNVDVSSHAPTLEAAQEAAEAAAARLLAEDAGVLALLGLRWIPVTERLPDEGATVLVHSTHRGVMVATYQMDLVRPAFFGHGHAPGTVTHWRPLPAAPEVPR